MFKYMKYEIKGTYKYILGILALVLILTTFMYTYVKRINSTGEVSALGGIFTGLSVLILFGTALATFLYIVGSFRRELYEDRGYLTFTLPLTGRQIVGSKLAVALLWFLVLGIAIAVYNVIMVLIFAPVELDLSNIFSAISEMILIKDIIFVALAIIINVINVLVVIYFSMALSRVTFRNKRIGGLWFIIFLVLSALLTYGQFMISEQLPYYIDLNTFNIGNMDTLSRQFYIEMNNETVMSSSTGMSTINIAASIFNIATTVLLFLGTSYLIEEKIDL